MFLIVNTPFPLPPASLILFVSIIQLAFFLELPSKLCRLDAWTKKQDHTQALLAKFCDQPLAVAFS